MMNLVQKLAPPLGVSQACQQLGVPRSSLYRSRQPKAPAKARPKPTRSLTDEQRAEVRHVLNSDRFQNSTPREVYAKLLDDDGKYLCHWRTMYRILADNQEVRERRNQLQHPSVSKPILVATAPNQVWSWDITHLPGPSPRCNFYLYVIIDIFSRYVPGWLVADREAASIADTLIRQTCIKQAIAPEQLTLHADRGGPMRAKTMAQLLTDLHISQSHSRPYTPNDNPYSEAHFKTMKYRPDFPDHFADQNAAQTWGHSFFDWYNFDHRHSALALMTPAMVHYDQVQLVQTQRRQVLQAAFEAHPDRFVRGYPTLPQVPSQVWINNPNPKEASNVL